MVSTLPLPVTVVICFVLGSLFTLGAIALWRSERRFLRTAVRTTGVIEDLVRSRSSRGRFPLVRFTTADGRSVVAQSNSTGPFYRIGQHVLVDYDPNNPSHIEMASFVAHWAGFGGLLFFGILLLWFGILTVKQMLSR